MKVTVFGATGVVGRALLPLLAEHEVTAVSRTPRDDAGARWVVADAATGEGVGEALAGADVAYYLVHSLGSRDFEQQDRTAAETVAAGRSGRGRAADRLPGRPRRRRPGRVAAPAEPARDGRAARVGGRAGDDAARRDDRRQGQRSVRDDPRPRQAAAGDDHAELGVDADAADRARRRRPLPRRRLRERGGVRRGLRRRRPGGDDVPADDRADRRACSAGRRASSRCPS